MYASARWINDYLNPPAKPDEQAELLTTAGFPLEGREEVRLESGEIDIRQDFEMTSNRGDCTCHLGLAREIAAISGRTLNLPTPEVRATGPDAARTVTVTNREKCRCPLYTARIIRGVKVQPSPQWLTDRLRAIGQIPRNNIVDTTNYVLFELGQPTHVFDLAKLTGPAIMIRLAREGETFLPIGEGEREIRLSPDDLLIADAEVPVAIGGVKGGALTAVTEATTDILIEAATFDPVTVRNSARRHGIESASAYRYERGVHPAQVNPAAERLVQLILELAGGELDRGVVADGAPLPSPREVTLRPERCRELLGVPIDDKTMIGYLERLGFQPKFKKNVIRCTAPCHRLDVEREVDLIEEIGRMFGHDKIPIAETIPIRAAPLQSREMARRAVTTALVGMGFVETVSHSLIGEKAAEPFATSRERMMRVNDERASAAPVLRPSVVPSLLQVRALNRDRGVGPLRLFEHAATFVDGGADHIETRRIGLLDDLDKMYHHSPSGADKVYHHSPSGATPLGERGYPSQDLRPLRGIVERIVEIVAGRDADVSVVPSRDVSWLEKEAQAGIVVNGETVGCLGVVSDEARTRFGLDLPVAAAEIVLEPFFDRFPPIRQVTPLPEHPSIERDISAIIDEGIAWSEVSALVESLNLDMLEAVEFVTTFRGKPIEAGRKSVTMRLRFRAADRTLKHDEVDPQVERAMRALRERLDAGIRT